MKNKIVAFSLIVFLLFLGFGMGAIVGGQLVSKDAGLAGSAEVIGYGLIGAVIAILLSILIIRKLEARYKQIALIIVILLSLGMYGLLHYRYLQKQKERNQDRIESPVHRRPTMPVDN